MYLVNTLVREAAAHEAFGLSDRERQVLQLIVAGSTNPEIAQHLCISRSTAKHHVASIIHKLGAANRCEAAVVALRAELV